MNLIEKLDGAVNDFYDRVSENLNERTEFALFLCLKIGQYIVQESLSYVYHLGREDFVYGNEEKNREKEREISCDLDNLETCTQICENCPYK